MQTSPVAFQLVTPPRRAYLRALVYGDLGSGRSSFATSFPNALVIDAWGTMYEREDRPDLPVLQSNDPNVIEAMIAQINEGLMQPDTVVIDGLPSITESIENTVAHIRGYDNWLAMRDRYAQLFRALLSVKANLVVTTRSKAEYARPGQVFGGKLITDMDKIILGTAPDVFKSLPEHFDVVFEMVRGGSGRPMVAVRNSVIRELETDEVITPDGGEILKRLTTLKTHDFTPESAPSAILYGSYLRLRDDAVATGLPDELMQAIRRASVARADRKSRHLTTGEIEAMNAYFLAYLAGEDLTFDDPTKPQRVAEVVAAPPVAQETVAATATTPAAVVSGAQEPVAEVATTPSEPATVVDATPMVEAAPQLPLMPETTEIDVPAPETSNVVQLPVRTEEPVPPSPAKKEWTLVKDLLTRYNSLLEQNDRLDEVVPSVTDFLRRNELFAEITTSGTLLAWAENATQAEALLRARIAEIEPQILSVAS